MSYVKLIVFSVVVLCSVITVTNIEEGLLAQVQKIQEQVCSIPEYKPAKKRFAEFLNESQKLINAMSTDLEYQSNCEAIRLAIYNAVKDLGDTNTITEEEGQALIVAVTLRFFPE